MVPKEQAKGRGTRGGNGRKGKSTARKKTKRQRGPTHKAREQAAGIVEPSVSIVVKDPLRVQILAIAIQRPISPSEFARETKCPLSTSSYHFRVLRDYGFLELVEKVAVRGSTKHMYRATKSGYISDTDWGQVSQALRPGVAGAALNDFNVRVTQALEWGTFYARDDSYLLWAPIVLDEVAWSEFVGVMAWAYHEVQQLEIASVERRAQGEDNGCIPATFAIAGFESPTAQEIKAKTKRKRKGAKRAGKKRQGGDSK